MTNEDIAVGEAALRGAVERLEGWMAAFVPESAERDGAIVVIREIDSGNNDAAACGAVLHNAIAQAGYGSQVTTEQCIQLAAAVISAVVASRAHHANPNPKA